MFLPRRSLLASSVVLAASLPSSVPVSPHEQPAHAQLTKEALARSERFDSALREAGLDRVALSDQWARLAERVPGILRLEGRTASDLVIAGSILEDGFPGGAGEMTNHRCLRHFQDTGGHGLGASPVGLTFPSAQQWGYGTRGSETNTFTWQRALQEYSKAVLGEGSEERRKALERALVALGCNLHLLQDQYSPAHTRDDPHPGHALPILDFPLGSSLLEVEGTRFLRWGHDEFAGEFVPTIAKSTHADFFADAVGWTANRFFSDDTIFEAGLLPDSLGVSYSSEDTCPVIPDQYVLSRTLDIAGTKLAFDSSLPWNVLFGLSLRASWCDPGGSLAIIRENLRRLAPRAVGSGVGLIDHFFRGKLGLTQDPQGNLIVTNQSAASGSGWNTFRGGRIRIAVEDSGTGARTPLYELPLTSGSLAAGEDLTIPRSALVAGGLLSGPVAKLYLVYEGRIGEEDGVAAMVFDYISSGDTCQEICVPYLYSVLAPAGDIDGNGSPDLVRSNRYQWLTHDTWAEVYSSRSCQPLFELPADQFAAQDLYPNGDVFGIGDVDGDGLGDLLLSGKTSQGAARIPWMSGATLQLGEPLPDPWTFLMTYAHTLGDLDGDGKDEFAAGSGLVFGVFSAQPMRLRWSSPGFLEPLEDYDGDGVKELRAWYQSGAYLVSGASGSPIFLPYETSPPYDWILHERVIPVRDGNGDGVPDLLGIGSSDVSHEDVALLSGTDGSPLWHRGFGGNVSSGAVWLGDWDGDGVEECLITEYSNGVHHYRLISTADGSDTQPPVTYRPPILQCTPLQRVGDVNHDGKIDYLCEQQDPPGDTCYHFVMGGSPW